MDNLKFGDEVFDTVFEQYVRFEGYANEQQTVLILTAASLVHEMTYLRLVQYVEPLKGE